MTNEIKDLKCLGALGNLQSFAIDGTKGSKIVDINVNIVKNYITNLQEENKIIDKIKKLRNANTHLENIYYAEGVLLGEPYFDIEDVDNEELLDILRGDE